jgi:putative ABC transport system substrate-binding protein
MRRRDIITLAGSAAAAWPLSARAQPARLPTIGVIGASESVWRRWLAAFEERLRQLGWIDGRTAAIVYRWTEGRSDRATEIAEELVRLKVDVIFANATSTPSVQRATSTIPIVFVFAADPVGTGLVASLAKPGGNATGLSSQSTGLAGKRFEFLREFFPVLRRPAILGTAFSSLEANEFEAAAHTIGLDVIRMDVGRAQDIVPAIEALKGGADALYICAEALFLAERVRIITTALGAKLPTMFVEREYVESGGLMSYGANYLGMFRRAAEMIDKILRGTRPADIPVEQPNQFELVFNLVTARALDLKVSPALLARADEVIE